MQLTKESVRARQHEGGCVGLKAAMQQGQQYSGKESCKHGQETARGAAQSTQEHKSYSQTVAVPGQNINDNQRPEDRTSAASASKHVLEMC